MAATRTCSSAWIRLAGRPVRIAAHTPPLPAWTNTRWATAKCRVRVVSPGHTLLYYFQINRQRCALSPICKIHANFLTQSNRNQLRSPLPFIIGFRRSASPSPYATALLPMTQHNVMTQLINHQTIAAESVYAKPESVSPSRLSYYASSQLTQVRRVCKNGQTPFRQCT